MPDLLIQIEPWTENLCDEIMVLAADHFQEVDGGVEDGRPFNLDRKLMAMLDASGAFLLVTARKDGALIGYITWNIVPDVESAGLVIALQGAWYVVPGQFGAGARLFDQSLATLKSRGVHCAYPHHRLQGRGAELGKFFRRRGAKLTQHTYSLWLGEA